MVVAIVLTIVAVIVLFFGLGLFSHSGDATGLVDGYLSKCPASPNCVSSEQHENQQHKADAIILMERSGPEGLHLLRKIILDMGGSIQTESDVYLAATFSSALFRFVDDLELRVDQKANQVHVRSASRVGHSDLGANRRRVEVLTQRYNERAGQ